MFWIAYGVMWISVTLSVTACVYITGSAWCLWALFIPAMIKFRNEEGKKENKDTETSCLKKEMENVPNHV